MVDGKQVALPAVHLSKIQQTCGRHTLQDRVISLARFRC